MSHDRSRRFGGSEATATPTRRSQEARPICFNFDFDFNNFNNKDEVIVWAEGQDGYNSK